MKTIAEILQLSTFYLEQKQVEAPRRSAEELLAEVLSIPRLELYMQFDRPLTESEIISCRTLLFRRGQGEPLPYILGHIEFYQCQLEITPSVLIPRPETEILVDKIVSFLKKQKSALVNKVLLDICCGSGCIAIALKKQFPEMQVVASDLSSAALEVAKRNSQKNETSIEFLEGDLLEPFAGRRADFIVCNPPYVSPEEFAHLSREVKEFEPSSALLGGEDGVAFYKRLANQLPAHLNRSARVWLEIGSQQGSRIKELFQSSQWVIKEIEKDWAHLDRFFLLEME